MQVILITFLSQVTDSTLKGTASFEQPRVNALLRNTILSAHGLLILGPQPSFFWFQNNI